MRYAVVIEKANGNYSAYAAGPSRLRGYGRDRRGG